MRVAERYVNMGVMNGRGGIGRSCDWCKEEGGKRQKEGWVDTADEQLSKNSDKN